MGSSDEMFAKMLDAAESAIYAFDKDRTILWANAEAKRLHIATVGGKVGVAQKHHLDDNLYFDNSGAPMEIPGPAGSMIDRAFKGEATKDLIMEHRNIKLGLHRWLKVSCLPVMKNGEFEYAIIVHHDISIAKNKENKLRFLVEAEKVLALQTDFRERLRLKAKLMVPSLADWCTIDIKHPNDRIARVVLMHRDPDKVSELQKYNEMFVRPGGERLNELVIRTGIPIFLPQITDSTLSRENFTKEQIERIAKLELSSCIVIPISAGNEILGSLGISYAESRRRYGDEDFIFFREFCAHLGLLLENERLNAEILARDRAKDTFLASLSHELRNPLAPIKSSLELIRLQKRYRGISEEIDIIEYQFGHMARLLNDLLDTSRLSQGKMQLSMSSFDLSEAARSILRSFTSVVRDAHISLTADLSEEPLMILGDRTRIEQTISNLMNNAVKFTPRNGFIHLSVNKEADEAVIRVRDTGEGITKDEMRHIFEPYYQSERLRSSNPGLGVGLNLVQKIVEMHGGIVSVVSEALQGSEFTIRLKLEEAVKLKNTASVLEENG